MIFDFLPLFTRTLRRPLSPLLKCGAALVAISSLLGGGPVAGLAGSAMAEVLVSDDFPTNGTLTGQTPSVGGIWTSVSGTANQIQVVNNRVQLTDANSEDVTTLFAAGVTAGNIYFGFDMSVADPGSYSGTDFEYFAHWNTTGSFQSRTDVAAFSASGWRPGQGGSQSTAEVVWGSDLAYGTDYRLVVGYDFTTGLSSLWVDPTAESDTSITTSSSVTGFTANGFNFRQADATPNQDFSIGSLRVATTFAEVLLVPPPVTPALDWYGDGLTAGGSGTWSTAGSSWSSNGGAAGAWDSTKEAVFGTTSGTVTVDGAGVSADLGLNFAIDGYTLTGGTVTLGGAAASTITVANGATATVNSVLAGTVTGVEKAGPGTLVLGAANTFVGPLSVGGGRLEVAADAALGDSTNGLILTGGTFAPTGSLALGASRNVTGSGGLDIASGQTLTVNGDYNAGTTLVGSGTLDLQGSVRNVGSLTFNAPGTVTAVGGITGSGVTAAALTSGTATVVPAIDLGTGTKTIDVGPGATLDLQGGVTLNGRLNKEGDGTLIMPAGSSINQLSLGNAFSSADGGVVRVSAAAALGSQTIFYNRGTVELTSPITTANAISFGGRAGLEAVVGGAGGNQSLTVSGNVSFFAGSGYGQTIVNINNVTTIDGTVSLAAGAANISGWTIGGTGRLNLTADSTSSLTAPITLADTVTLNVTGSTANNVTVGSTNVLTGTGTIGGIVGGAGSIQPGASPGILAVGQVDPSASTSFVLEYTGALPDYSNATASGNDVIRVTNATPFVSNMTASNTVDMFLGVTSITIGNSFEGGFYTDTPANFTASLADATLNYYVLGDGNGTDATLASQGYYSFATWKSSFSSEPDLALALGTIARTAAFAGGSVNGQAMVVSAVPEPGSMMLLGLAGVGLASVALRRRNRAVSDLLSTPSV